MTSATHIAFIAVGVLTYSTLTNWPCPLTGLVVAALGSLLPDLDTPHSLAGRCVWYLSRPFERRFGHRTLTHSLLGMLLFAALTLPLLWWPGGPTYALLVAGYISHPLLDTLSKRGIDLLYPSTIKAVMPGHSDYRMVVGGPGEMVLCVGLTLGAVALYPASAVGIERLFNRWSGDFARALRQVPSHAGPHALWLTGTFRHSLTDQRLAATRYRVLGKEGSTLLVLDADQVVSVGEAPDKVQRVPLHVALEPGDPLHTTSQVVPLASRPLAALAAVAPPDREHWLLGELVLEEPLHTPPVVQHYATVHATGRTLRLHYARLADLRPYAHVVVAQGEVLVKQRVPQPSVPAGTAWASPAAPIHATPSASLPLVQRVPVVATVRSLADVAVRQGDPVRVGQLLATDHSRDADLAATQAQLQAASLPPPPEPGTSLPLQHVVGDPDTLLRQGVIDRREYQQILSTRTTLARQEQQRQSRLTELRSKLAALERQQRVLSPVAGTVQQLKLTEQKDAALRVELTLEVPLPTSSLAASGPLALPAAAIPPPRRP